MGGQQSLEVTRCCLLLYNNLLIYIFYPKKLEKYSLIRTWYKYKSASPTSSFAKYLYSSVNKKPNWLKRRFLFCFSYFLFLHLKKLNLKSVVKYVLISPALQNVKQSRLLSSDSYIIHYEQGRFT